ncbi:VCBS repeat-containing protein [Streptomyces sp. NPDC002133]|uniref:FG-GAP repeat domain-containing protein n=1 Tax=Streptomyces sp. NPDC002133 TaxID=3154409 RepID=UPI00332B8737
MLSSLPRPRTRRQRLTTAIGASLVVIAGGTWLLLGTGPQPGDHAPMPICAVDGFTLRADVDADGHLDEINEGTTSVVFQRDDHQTTVRVDDARGFWQKLRGASKDDMATRGAFGDFDGDGYLDLAIFYSQRDEGDSPRDNMVVHEAHYGPLARDLSSDRTGTIRLGSSSFVHEARAIDTNHDGRAELEVFQSGGDGSVSRYIGRQDRGGVSVSRKETDSYGVSDRPYREPNALAYGTCDDR